MVGPGTGEPIGPPTLEIETIDEVEIGDLGARRPKPADAGGRRRRKQALVVVGVAVLSAVAGVGIGSRLKSPAERAADREPPTASRVTVPVERRTLQAATTLTGSVDFNQPIQIRLGGPVGASAGSAQVITKAPTLDTAVNEGDVITEVSGRPVFMFQGALPVYRAFGPRDTGPDVTQLEEALVRLGVHPGPADGTYDDVTEAAIDELYFNAGYASEGPSEEQRTSLRDKDKAIVEAEQRLAEARDALAKGGTTITPSERLQLQQAIDRAAEGVTDAEAEAKRNNDAAAAKIVTDTGLRDAAKSARDAAATVLTQASIPGAINPNTQSEYTSIELAGYQADLAEKEAALLTAQQSLNESITAKDTVAAAGTRAVKTAKDELALAQLSQSDRLKPADTTSLRDAVTAAQAVVDQARLDKAAIEAESGTTFPAGEMIFVPALPSTITSVNPQAIPGAIVPTAELATLSSTETRITARVSRGDAALLRSGMPVDITVRDVAIETTGVIESVGAPQTEPSEDGSDFGGGGSGSGTTRLQVVVVPDDSSLFQDIIGASARISIPVATTAGPVLAVPEAAVFTGPDRTTRVEVERVAATDDDPGSTEVIEVKVGLAAQGLVEITPLDGTLTEGDRVVVGGGGADPSADETDETDAAP